MQTESFFSTVVGNDMLTNAAFPVGGCSAEFGDGGQEVSWGWLCTLGCHMCLPSLEPTL